MTWAYNNTVLALLRYLQDILNAPIPNTINLLMLYQSSNSLDIHGSFH